MNIIQIVKRFPTKKDVIEFLEIKRWNGTPVCPYCGSARITPAPKEQRHHCNACNKKFSVTVGTVFHNVKGSLQAMLCAVSLMADAKKGKSSRELARNCGIDKDTAWRYQIRIMEAMKEGPDKLCGIVEVDTMWYGPDMNKMNKKAKENAGNGAKKEHKTGIMGAKQRGGPLKFLFVQSESSENLIPAIKSVVAEGSTIYTDSARGTLSLGDHYPIHEKVNHKNGEYVRDGEIHTNSIEGFWSMFDRGRIGQYHKISKKYLMLYLQQFAFRNTHKDHPNMFDLILNRMLGVC